MLIFLYGPDTYRSRQKLKEIVEEYKKACLVGKQANPNWLDFVKIDAENLEINIFDELRRVIDTVSMFSNKKLIIIENVFSASEWLQEEISEFFKKRNLEKDKDIIVVFLAEEVNPVRLAKPLSNGVKPESNLFKFLKSKAKFQEFDYLKGFQLKNWIRDYIVKQNGSIGNEAIEKLINYIGNDLWRMSNELEKLLNYSKSIEARNIELLVKPEIDLNIFNLVDALGQKNKGRALKLFNQHLKKGENESYLFSMFVYQVRNLIKVKSSSSGKLDMRPYVLMKTSQQARNFSFEELKKIYRKLLEIDLDVKTGKTDVKTALEMFIVAL